MLLRFQKPAVRENCETGNQAFSMRLRFLSIRAIGSLFGFSISMLIASQLYGVAPADIVTLIAVTSTQFGIALFACWFPARRAMRVDPMVALRYETTGNSARI